MYWQKVKYRTRHAIQCDTPEEVDEAERTKKRKEWEIYSEPKIMSGMPEGVYFFGCVEDICGKYIVGQAQCR